MNSVAGQQAVGPWWAPMDDGLVLAVRVTPGASRAEVVDASGDVLRVRVAAPASKGQANVEVEQLIARLLGVRPSAVTVVRGVRSRDKLVEVVGVDEVPAAVVLPE